MNKDFISDYEEWLFHENAWNSYEAKEITAASFSAYKLAVEATRKISNSSLDGISPLYISVLDSKIEALEASREKLGDFCKNIHLDAENLIDDVFNYGVMKTLTDVYALNPNDITCTLGGTEYKLKTAMATIMIDPDLKADFLKKAGKLDKDEVSDDLKAGLIDAVSRYYDGDVTPYMKNDGAYDIKNFKEDIGLVIEYYEYMKPKDAKNMNNLLSGLAKDKNSKYQEDIRNIKFIAYTAQEPYRSLFFKYAKDLKIGDYNYHENNSSGKEMAQHYNRQSKKLYVRFYQKDPYNKNNDGRYDPRGAYVTFFHEVGHAIDDLSLDDDKFLFITKNYNFTTVNADGPTVLQAAEKDVKANIKNSILEYIEDKGYEGLGIDADEIVKSIMTYNFSGYDKKLVQHEIYDAVTQEYKNKFSMSGTNATIYCGISDVYGGFTDNKLNGTYQHDNSKKDGSTYWNNLKANNKYTGSQAKELWAEVFSRYMTSNEESIRELEAYFPTAMQLMNEQLIESKGR